jgi:hypothetical protein
MDIPNDVSVLGILSCQSFSYPNGSIFDAAVGIGSGPGAQISAAKLTHQYEDHYNNTPATSNAVTDRKVIHIVKGGTGTVIEFAAGAAVLLTGNDTVTIDLLKNGVSILSSPISLAATDTVRVLKPAVGYSNVALVAGDWLEVNVVATHNTGTLPQGVVARLTTREDPA